MPHKLGLSDLVTFCNSLKQYFPHSLKVHGLACSLIDEKWKGVDIWVDKWPDYSAVISSPDQDCCEDRFDKYYYEVFARDNISLEQLLYHPGVVNWKKEIQFEGVSSQLLDTIRKAAKYHGGHIMPIAEGDIFVLEETDLPQLSIPDDILVGSVSPELADTVSKNWEYARSGSTEYIKNILQNFPSVILFSRSGDIIGYELVHPHGFLGFLYVMPEFRRRGYGKLITTLAVRKLISMNKIPWVTVVKNNSASICFHEQLGFKKVYNGTLEWFKLKLGPKSLDFNK